MFAPTLLCSDCGVCRIARAAALAEHGTTGTRADAGPMKDVGEYCGLCRVSRWWALWAGLLPVTGADLELALSPLFVDVCNRVPEAEDAMWCETCGRRDQACFDCASPERRIRFTATLSVLDAMNYE
jgi:hypothetical protein